MGFFSKKNKIEDKKINYKYILRVYSYGGLAISVGFCSESPEENMWQEFVDWYNDKNVEGEEIYLFKTTNATYNYYIKKKHVTWFSTSVQECEEELITPPC